MADISGPGAGDVFDPWDLDDVRARIVMPLLQGLFRPGDLEAVDLGRGPRVPVPGFWSSPPGLPDPLGEPYTSTMILRSDDGEQPTALEADEELWLLVTAAGSTWHSRVWAPAAAAALFTMAEVAVQLADHLEDWVCEDVYRGEQAVVKAVIPARVTGR